jgi:uncharacterized protein
MSLHADLSRDMTAAMKSRDQVKLDTIRFLMAQLKNLAIDKGSELTDLEIQQAIAKQIKQQKEVIEQYKNAQRTDLADEEAAQVAILEQYLPQQLSDEELRAVILSVRAELPDAQMGQLIGAVNKQVAGKADGARIAAAVKQELGI